jgi:hypothetical protein
MNGECGLSGKTASLFPALLVSAIAFAPLFKGKEDQDYASRFPRQDR